MSNFYSSGNGSDFFLSSTLVVMLLLLLTNPFLLRILNSMLGSSCLSMDKLYIICHKPARHLGCSVLFDKEAHNETVIMLTWSGKSTIVSYEWLFLKTNNTCMDSLTVLELWCVDVPIWIDDISWPLFDPTIAYLSINGNALCFAWELLTPGF